MKTKKGSTLASICPPPPPTSHDDSLVVSSASTCPPQPPTSRDDSLVVSPASICLPPPPTSHDDSLVSSGQLAVEQITSIQTDESTHSAVLQVIYTTYYRIHQPSFFRLPYSHSARHPSQVVNSTSQVHSRMSLQWLPPPVSSKTSVSPHTLEEPLLSATLFSSLLLPQSWQSKLVTKRSWTSCRALELPSLPP